MTADETSFQTVAVRVDWSHGEDVPAVYVNAFASQLGTPTKNGNPDGVYLVLGHIVPPLIVGDQEEMQRGYRKVAETGIKVDVKGHFHISRERLGELIEALQTTADNFDKAAKPAISDIEEAG